VIFDVDGVLTDDSVYIGPNGQEFKRFNISDGLGIALMQKKLGVRVAALSGRKSEATNTRSRELNIDPCVQGEVRKARGVKSILKSTRVKAADAAFVGNEILDLPAFAEVGLKIAVADAAPELVSRADVVLRRSGGYGAARELFELLSRAREIDYLQWYER
jgi:3-deoxy-D-manno-octulosonate 8-phosphate phosphatase (KDO 8-P phosphatase)